jgi:hypothetical protein
MNELEQSIAAIKNYIVWCNSGQMIQVEMNMHNPVFGVLWNDCKMALTQITSINTLFQNLTSDWQQNIQTPVAMESVLLASVLRQLSLQCNDLVNNSNSIQSQAILLQTQVNSQIINQQQLLQNAQFQCNQDQQNFTQAVNNLNQARRQDCLIPFLTFGLDNKMQQDENAQNAAQSQMWASQQALTSLQSSQNALRSANTVLFQLSNINTSFTALQNLINTTYTDCQNAATDIQNSSGANSTSLSEVFMKQIDALISNLIAVGGQINYALGL